MNWKDLSYLEEVEFIRGYSQITGIEESRLPDRCVVIKDYGKTLLIGMIYEKDYYGRPMEKKTIRKAVPKGALYVGDVLLRADTYLVGREVTNEPTREL